MFFDYNVFLNKFRRLHWPALYLCFPLIVFRTLNYIENFRFPIYLGFDFNHIEILDYI